jgi:bifunctional non-homologous end joining protein LigD
MLLHARNGTYIFYSRKGLDWTHPFPEIAAAGAALGKAIVDGEVCAVGSDGLPSFAGLTDALSAKQTGRLVYYVFDMMAGQGENLISFPLCVAALPGNGGRLKCKGRERALPPRFLFEAN